MLSGLSQKKPERKTSLEKLSFQSRQVGSRILAKTELLATSFVAILQLHPELPPGLVIAGLQISRLQVLLFCYHHGHQTNRATHHHPRNSAPWLGAHAHGRRQNNAPGH